MHNIEMVNGQAQMAYAGETPWHGLGTRVSNDLSPRQMMEMAGCDWKVQKVPSFVELGGVKVATGQESLVRTSDNRILTNVGPNWEPLQNADAFEFFNEYVMAGDMEMHTAGSLDDGRIVWCLAKVKESFDILGGDQVDSYLLLSNPHKYGQSIDVRFSPIRVVCNNTLSMAIAGQAKNGVKVGHRSQFNADMVKDQLGIAHNKFEQYKEVASFLASKRFTAESLIQYYNEVFPRTYQPKNKQTQVKTIADLTKNGQAAFSALETQPGAKFGEGSWWQAFNSVTYLTDHHMGTSADKRMQSAWFGTNQTRKIKAIEKAVEFATAA